MHITKKRAVPALAAGALVALALTGCSISPASMSNLGGSWKIGMPTSSDKHVIKTPAVKKTATPVIEDDLSTGTVTHDVTTGDGTFVITWWTPSKQNTGASMPIEVHIGLKSCDTKRSYTLTSVDIDIDGKPVTKDNGAWDVTPPFGYQAGLIVPTGKQVEVTLDATLTATTGLPKSTALTHDSVSDVLEVFQDEAQ